MTSRDASASVPVTIGRFATSDLILRSLVRRADGRATGYVPMIALMPTMFLRMAKPSGAAHQFGRLPHDSALTAFINWHKGAPQARAALRRTGGRLT